MKSIQRDNKYFYNLTLFAFRFIHPACSLILLFIIIIFCIMHVFKIIKCHKFTILFFFLSFLHIHPSVYLSIHLYFLCIPLHIVVAQICCKLWHATLTFNFWILFWILTFILIWFLVNTILEIFWGS